MYMGMMKYMYWVESGYRNPYWVSAGGPIIFRAFVAKNENPGESSSGQEPHKHILAHC